MPRQDPLKYLDRLITHYETSVTIRPVIKINLTGEQLGRQLEYVKPVNGKWPKSFIYLGFTVEAMK